MSELYYSAKVIHIIGFVAWFAGLFYLVRMFVYHAEARDLPEPESGLFKKQYTLMEWRAYRIICNPAMMITWTAGLVMLGLGIWLEGNGRINWLKASDPLTGTPGWMHAKLLLVVLLTIYHLWCKRMIRKLEADSSSISDFGFRLLNEVPTVLLIAIAFLASFGMRGVLNYGYLAIGLLLFTGLLYWGARAYKKRREKLLRQSPP